MQALFIEPFGNLSIGVMIEQAVDLIDDGLIGLAQLPARLGQRQFQATRFAATETDVNVDLLRFEQGDVLDEQAQ